MPIALIDSCYFAIFGRAESHIPMSSQLYWITLREPGRSVGLDEICRAIIIFHTYDPVLLTSYE